MISFSGTMVEGFLYVDLFPSAALMMSQSSREALKGSGAAQIAETTAMQSAPAMTASLALDALRPPIATKEWFE
jgi:hypothetical protein